MGNDNTDTLYKPPETITLLNVDMQQDLMGQPQQDLMGQPQQDLMGQPQGMLEYGNQNTNNAIKHTAQMFTDNLFNDANSKVMRDEDDKQKLKKLETEQRIEDEIAAAKLLEVPGIENLNIGALLSQNQPKLEKPVKKKKVELGREDPEIAKQWAERVKKDDDLRKQEDEEKRQWEQEKLEKEEKLRKEELEAEEEDFAKHIPASKLLEIQEYKKEQELKREQERLAELEKEATDKEQFREAGKVKFESGINSKPNCCERRSRNKKVKAAKRTLETDLGVTHLTENITDNISKFRRSDGIARSVAQQEMLEIAKQRRASELEKRDKQEAERKEREKKNEESAKAKGVDYVRKPAPMLKKIEEGMTDKENSLISLVEWAPIKLSSQLASPNETTRAVVLKVLVDRALTYNINPEMICSVALASQVGNVHTLNRNVPIVAQLLNDDPKAAALIDGQKLELFRSVEKMVPVLKKGMDEGLRLNGLDGTGNSYYQTKKVNVEDDKKEAIVRWAEASNELHVQSKEHQVKMQEYTQQSQECWEQHEKRSIRTNLHTNTHRLGVDSAAVNMTTGTKLHGSERAEAFAKMNKMGSFANAGLSVQNTVVGLLPANATQKMVDEHAECFKKDHLKEGMNKIVGDFFQMDLPKELFSYENIGKQGKMQEILLLKDKLKAISALPTMYKDVFNEMPEYVVKLIKSAQKVADAIDQQLKFFEALYCSDPSNTLDQTLVLSESVRGSQRIYTSFWNNFINATSRFKTQ